jgi:glycosyltransferase involved in cell wall biosynthesis
LFGENQIGEPCCPVKGEHRMRIAIIAPPWYAIPPLKYGGIERVIYDLSEAFVQEGNDVFLLAPPGSRTSATLIPITDRDWGLDLPDADKHQILADAGRRAFEIAADLDVDIIHDHTDVLFLRPISPPIAHTVHGPATPEAIERYLALTGHGDWFIAISARQQELFEQGAAGMTGDSEAIRFAGAIPNPLDVAGTPFYPSSAKDDYVAYIGRCHWEKGPATAILVAQRAGIPLMMAMRISEPERPYFEEVIRPMLDRARGLVEFVGEVGGHERDELFGRARAVLFSSIWEEPFGLVMTEALAHGTPVVALRRGSSPEIIANGVTGILCDSVRDLPAALHEAMRLDGEVCRRHAMARFDRCVVAQRYLETFTWIRKVRALQGVRANCEDTKSVTGSLIPSAVDPASIALDQRPAGTKV